MNRNGRRSSVAIRSGLLEHQCYPLFLDSLKASSSSKSETRVNNRKRGHLLEYTHTHQLKDPGPSSSSHAGGAGRSWDASCACSFGSLNACEVGYFGGQNKVSGCLPELLGENKQYRELPAPA